LTDEITESSGNYGHASNEWGSKDDSEKIQWEEHYGKRNNRWGKKTDDASEPDDDVDATMGDET
jgi:hypothetical protein